MSENDGSNAQAGGNAAPADPNARGSAVDLSDLQAELDKSKPAQSDEDAGGDDESADDGAEGDDTATDADDDPFKDEGDEGDGEDEDEAETDDEGESDDADKAKKKRSRSDRYKNHIARLERENQDLRSRTPAAVSEAQIEAEVVRRIGTEPQEKDFPDYLTWEREHTAWLLDKRQTMRTVKSEAQQDVQAQQRANIERVGAHKERLETFGPKVKDFDKVMAEADKRGAKVSPVVEDLVLDSDKSAHLVYYFARNPGRLAAINQMNQRDAAREIGRIESRLSLPQPKTQSKAPAPPKSRPGGGASASNQDAQLDSYLSKTYGKGRR